MQECRHHETDENKEPAVKNKSLKRGGKKNHQEYKICLFNSWLEKLSGREEGKGGNYICKKGSLSFWLWTKGDIWQILEVLQIFRSVSFTEKK